MFLTGRKLLHEIMSNEMYVKEVIGSLNEYET